MFIGSCDTEMHYKPNKPHPMPTDNDIKKIIPPIIQVKSLQDSARNPNLNYMHLHYQMTCTPQQKQIYLDIPKY